MSYQELIKGREGLRQFVEVGRVMLGDRDEKALAKADVESMWWESMYRSSLSMRQTLPKGARRIEVMVWVSGTGPSHGPRRHIPQARPMEAYRDPKTGRVWAEDSVIDNHVNAYLPRGE